MEELADIPAIARLLGASVRTVRDRYVHAPDFPPPTIAPSNRKRKWSVSRVLAWAAPKRVECFYCGALCETPCHQLKNIDLAKTGCTARRKTPTAAA